MFLALISENHMQSSYMKQANDGNVHYAIFYVSEYNMCKEMKLMSSTVKPRLP